MMVHQIRALILMLCTLGALASAPAEAAGVVVRLVASGLPVEGDVVVTVVNGAETETRFVLLDDGQSPDVFAGDNQYSAAGMLSGTEATVYLTIKGSKLEAGEVTWPDDTTSRDLVITMGDGILTVENSAAAMTAEFNEAAGAPSAPEGGSLPPVDTEPGSPNPSTTGDAPVVTFPGGPGVGQADTTLYLLGGALILVLAVVAFFWLRSPGSSLGAPKPSRLYTQQPEPGLLGSAAPSLSDGLSTWRAGLEDAPAFMELLLQSMVQHHRVLVVCPEEAMIPPLHGGPIYRARQDAAVAVADAAISLMEHPGLPLAVLVAQPKIKTELLQDYASVLTPDVGVVALVSEFEGDHPIDVEIARAADGWHLKRGDTDVHIRLTEWGARVSPAGAPSGPT